MKRKYGDREVCSRCSQDIEWSGRRIGWTDRGGNWHCPTYKNKAGEFVTPKGLKHTIAKGVN